MVLSVVYFSAKVLDNNEVMNNFHVMSTQISLGKMVVGFQIFWINRGFEGEPFCFNGKYRTRQIVFCMCAWKKSCENYKFL